MKRKFLPIAAVIVSAALASGAAAQDEAPSETDRSIFARRPTLAEFDAAIPADVNRNLSEATHRNGALIVRIVLRCRALDDGTLADCEVKQEIPRVRGLAEAMLSLADKFRVYPEAVPMVDGVRMVDVPIGFRTGERRP